MTHQESYFEYLMAHALDSARAQRRYRQWRRTRDEILAALAGDPVARAENVKKVALMRQREERGE